MGLWMMGNAQCSCAWNMSVRLWMRDTAQCDSNGKVLGTVAVHIGILCTVVLGTGYHLVWLSVIRYSIV